MYYGLMLAASEGDYDSLNPFSNFTHDDGSIDVLVTMCNISLMIAYIRLLFLVPLIIYDIFQHVLLHERGKIIKELLQTPYHERREALLDMCFWHVKHLKADGEIRDEVLAHFERKLPALSGKVPREVFTRTEAKVMECIRKTLEAEQKIQNERIRSGILGYFALGPFRARGLRDFQLGPHPSDLELWIATRKTNADDKRLIDV